MAMMPGDRNKRMEDLLNRAGIPNRVPAAQQRKQEQRAKPENAKSDHGENKPK